MKDLTNGSKSLLHLGRSSLPAQSIAIALAVCFLLSAGVFVPAVFAQSEVPAGRRFIVELRDKLDAKKVKRGKKFDARTLEAIQTSDGRVIPAGAKMKGRVAYMSDREMQLRFEEIRAPWGKTPIVASVVAVPNERGVKDRPDDEGDIKASGGGRGKHAVIGGLIGAGVGAAVGGATKGDASAVGKGAAIGGGAGLLIGAAHGGKRLVLHEGTRLEVELERPLVLVSNSR